MTSPGVPDVPAFVVDAITKMLIEDQQLNRPPEKAAHLLAIICKLYEQRRPFPRRRDIADKIGSPLATVDAALSTRLDEDYISVRIETRPGNVQKRNSVIRERYYDPSDKLFLTYREASRRSTRPFQGVSPDLPQGSFSVAAPAGIKGGGSSRQDREEDGETIAKEA